MELNKIHRPVLFLFSLEQAALYFLVMTARFHPEVLAKDLLPGAIGRSVPSLSR